MPKNTLFTLFSKNSAKNRGNKTQKILKRDFFNFKKSAFRYVPLKNHNSDWHKTWGNCSLGEGLQKWCRDFFYFTF